MELAAKASLKQLAQEAAGVDNEVDCSGLIVAAENSTKGWNKEESHMAEPQSPRSLGGGTEVARICHHLAISEETGAFRLPYSFQDVGSSLPYII